MKRGTKRKFGRTTDQRNAFLKSLATALISHGKITTTKARAKSLRPYIEKMITVAKKQSIAGRRELARTLHATSVKKLVDVIAPQFSTRAGGYTRIIPLGRRQSDGSETALVEFVS